MGKLEHGANNPLSEEFRINEYAFREEISRQMAKPAVLSALHIQWTRHHAAELVKLLYSGTFDFAPNGYSRLSQNGEDETEAVGSSDNTHVTLGKKGRDWVLHYDYHSSSPDATIGAVYSHNPLRFDRRNLYQFFITQKDGFLHPHAIFGGISGSSYPGLIQTIDCIPPTEIVPFRRLAITLSPELIKLYSLITAVTNPKFGKYIISDTDAHLFECSRLLLVEIGSVKRQGADYSVWTQAESAAIPLTETQPGVQLVPASV